MIHVVRANRHPARPPNLNLEIPMEALIKTVAWLTNHSLHQHGDHTPTHQAPEQPARGGRDPVELLGLDRLSYRAAWDAQP
jgi:hypothetical protein